MTGHATRLLAPDHTSTSGHFPGNPIIPGAFLLQLVAAAVADTLPGESLHAVESAKFVHPVRPGETIAIDWVRADSGAIRFTCMIAPSGPRAATGVLRFGPA